MKKFLFLATAIAAVGFTACEEEEPVGPVPKVVITADPATIQVGGSTTFTVTADGVDVTDYCVENGTISEHYNSTPVTITSATWTPVEAGEYSFSASYRGGTSASITVTVTAKPVPVLAADPTEIATGETTTFTVTVDGTDVTSTATITEGENIVEPTWSTSEPGDYNFVATYDGVTSNIVMVRVTTTPMPAGSFDYTDNALAPFVLAPTDIDVNGDGVWDWSDNMTHANAVAGAPEGWRLPTYNEGMLILIYANAYTDFNMRGASFWTSTFDKTDASSAMTINPLYGYASSAPAAGETAIRYVATVNAGRKTYPYVDTSSADGPVIVSRDADGGIVAKARQATTAEGEEMPVFHDVWETTPSHVMNERYPQGAVDAVPRKLQVANADAGADMLARTDAIACPDGWRVPTHMEGMLIFAMGGGVASSYDATGTSANPVIGSTPLHSVAGFTPLRAEYYWLETFTGGRGSSRMAFPFYATPRYGSGKIRDDYSNADAYLRCVRDVQ